MSNDLTTTSDGFDKWSYDDDGGGGGGIDTAIRILYKSDTKWITAITKEPLPLGRELVAGNIERSGIKFNGEGERPDVRVLAAHEKFALFDALNKKIPKEKWGEFNGNLVGPWKPQHVVSFIDETSLNKYVWPSMVSTIGSRICVEELVSKVKWMRKWRPGAIPVVKLSEVFMNTKFGGRMRPSLEIIRWIAPVTPTAVELPPPSPQPAPAQVETTPSTAPVEVKPQTISEPSLGEQMSDKILFKDGDADKSGCEASASPKKRANKAHKPAQARTDAIAEILDEK